MLVDLMLGPGCVGLSLLLILLLVMLGLAGEAEGAPALVSRFPGRLFSRSGLCLVGIGFTCHEEGLLAPCHDVSCLPGRSS